MDQSAVNKIILDSTVGDSGCRCNELEKEFMLLKGSIKKLIIDIREKMNDSDNPFKNLESLDRMVSDRLPELMPDPVISDDTMKPEPPVKASEDVVEAPKVSAKKEEDMTQVKRDSENNRCPFATRAGTVQDHCPLVVTSNSIDKRCAMVRESRVPDNSCPMSSHGCDAVNYGSRDNGHSEYCDRDRRSGGNAYPASSRDLPDRTYCSACGQLLNPGYDTCTDGGRAMPYPSYSRRTWYDRSDDGGHQGSRQAAYARRPLNSGYPEYEAGYAGNYPAPLPGPGRDGYPPQGLRRQNRASPRYSPAYGAGYEHDEYQEYQQPSFCGTEPEYYRPRPVVRRGPVASGNPQYGYYESPPEGSYVYDPYRLRPRERGVPVYPENPREAYYESTGERVEGDWYEPVDSRAQQPRRRSGKYSPPSERESFDEYELTEPRPEIEDLADQSEPVLPRTRKKSRRMIGIVELPEPELVDVPNPRPRRSRSVKPGG